ncbi:MAG: helix-turn-helix domain-containing protein [Clostridiales bacterium]|nr:helix-turn-helix domain-containing protein [Clostridiales bacterium]
MLSKSLLPRRQFISFFIAFGIFLVILMGISLPLLSHQSRQVEKNNRQIYTEIINHNLQKSDAQITSYKRMIQFWGSKNSNFAMLCSPGREIDYLGLGEFSGEMKNSILSFPAIKDAVIVTRANAIITPSTVVVDRVNLPAYFFRDSFVLEGVSSLDDFKALFDRTLLCMPVKTHSYDTYHALIFLQPIYNHQMQSIAHALFTVDVEELLQSTAPDELLENSYVQILWKGNPIYTRGEAPEKNAVVLTAQGVENALSIAFHVSPSVLNAGVGSAFNTMGLLVITAFLGGLALTVFFLMRTTTPMRSLMQKAQTLAPDVQARDEYEYVSQVLGYLDHSLQKNSQELEAQRQILQQNFLERALLGNITSRRSRLDFDIFFPDFPEKYMVALLYLPIARGDRPIDFTVSKQLLVEERLSEIFADVPYHLNITPNLIALILPEDARAIPNLEKLQAGILRDYQMSINIFVSEAVSGPEYLSEAYAQAKRIHRLATGYIEKRVWQIANFPQREMLSSMDYSILQQLYESISNGEKETALRCLKRLQVSMVSNSLLEGDGLSAQPFHRLLSFLHSILIRIKQEHFSLLSAVQLLPPELNQPLENYFLVLEGYVITLCDALYTRKHQPTAYSEDIVAYVDQHFTDPNLYQKTVTDYFNISEKVLQSAIRSQTQLSFAEYLEKKRLDLAHQLLLQTNMNVKEIGAQAGFSLYNTFYKAFKRRWGCSPTEYQLQYGHILKNGDK